MPRRLRFQPNRDWILVAVGGNGGRRDRDALFSEMLVDRFFEVGVAGFLGRPAGRKETREDGGGD